MDSTGLSSAAAALWAPSSATTCLLSSTAIPLVFTSCAAVSSSPSPASPSLSSQRRPILLTFLLMVQLTVRSSIIRSPAPSRTRHSEPGPRKLSRFVSSWPAYSSSLFSPLFTQSTMNQRVLADWGLLLFPRILHDPSIAA